MPIIARLLSFIAPARTWLIGGAVLAVVVAGGWLWMSRASALSDLEAAQARYNQLEAAHTGTLAALDRVRKDAEIADSIIARETARRQAVESLNAELTRSIDNAPDNGCVGPAVRSVVDGLREAVTDYTD
jgi:hypothetical protein